MDQINGITAEPWDERPRDVFVGACGVVAAGLAADGFSYARSGPHATRRDGPWKFMIRFQSGRIGTDFSIHYSVHNKDFLAWRRQFGEPTGIHDMVTGMNLGFLSPIRNWVTYYVEDPVQRSRVLDLALANIRDLALPFFDRFADPLALAQELATSTHPGFFWEGSAVRFVAWQLGPTAAEQCLVTHLEPLFQAHDEALDEFRRGRDDPDYMGAHAASMLGRDAGLLGLGASI